MADQETHSLASTFPNPPPFWTDFTPERIARIEELREATAAAAAAQQAADADGDRSAAADAVRLPDLPDDLASLQPPPEPADGRWRVFGDQYMLDDRLPTLEDQGITNLAATAGAAARTASSSDEAGDARDAKLYDGAFELKKLTKSLLLNFLEMVGVLSRNPSHAEAKMADLRTLFINIHHVLNEYRPHQARESAIAMMQDHLDRTRAETLAIRSQVEKARRVLEGLGSLRLAAAAAAAAAAASEEEAEDGSSGTGGGEDARAAAKLTGVDEDREREVWAATDAACA